MKKNLPVVNLQTVSRNSFRSENLYQVNAVGHFTNVKFSPEIVHICRIDGLSERINQINEVDFCPETM
jgi:hypothetical protein